MLILSQFYPNLIKLKHSDEILQKFKYGILLPKLF